MLPQSLRDTLSPVTVICGHYGVGKTNFSVNLACDLAASGLDVTLIDLDLVNPYFRATEQRILLEEHGVNLIAPVFAEAGSCLDVPSIRGSIAPAIQDTWEHLDSNKIVLIDAGGDDVGATALGRFSHLIKLGSYAMLYVINSRRFDTKEPNLALGVLREIELACGLTATAIVDNTHLKDQTTVDMLFDSYEFASEFSKKSGLPLACKTAKNDLVDTLYLALCANINSASEHAKGDTLPKELVYPIHVYVKNPWE